MTTQLTGPAFDLRAAVKLHRQVLDVDGRSPKTTDLYARYERAFVAYLEEMGIVPTLDSLNMANVRAFLAWLRARPGGHRPREGSVAVRTAAVVLKRWGSVLEDNALVTINPLAKLRRPKVAKHLRQPFTADETTAMWEATKRKHERARNPALSARDEALFLLLVDTGMRIGEAMSLRLEQLDLDHGRVTVMGKGRRERTIPLSPDGRTMRALRRWLELRKPRVATEPHVFLSRFGDGLLPKGGYGIIKRIGERAGVQNVFPHRLRHSMATWYLTVYPGDELGLRRIVGHVSMDVLADYVHLSDATIAERVGRASLVESLSTPERVDGAVIQTLPTRPAAASPAAKPMLDKESLLEALSDPAIRRAVLETLLGSEA